MPVAAHDDSTFVLAELLRRGITNAGIAMFWDPIVVNLAKSAERVPRSKSVSVARWGPCRAIRSI